MEDRKAKFAAAAAPARAGEAAAAAPEAADWGGPLGILMRLAGRGVKRLRESENSTSNSISNGGEVVQRATKEPENPWQVCGSD